MKGGSRVVVEPHRHDGVFIAKGKEDALVTKNMVPGEAVYNEKRISVQVSLSFSLYFYIYVYICIFITKSFSFSLFLTQNEDGSKVEYRVWNPFRSKLAAAILGGVDDVWIVITPFLCTLILLNIYTHTRIHVHMCVFVYCFLLYDV